VLTTGLCRVAWLSLRRCRLLWRTTLLIVGIVAGAGSLLSQQRQQRMLFLYPDSRIPAMASLPEGARKKLAEPNKRGTID
jgi:hypothetical protein